MRAFLLPSVLLMIFGGLFGVTRATEAQDLDLSEVIVSLDFSEIPLQQALDAIEEQTELAFAYSYDAIDLNREVSVATQQQSVEHVLKHLFRDHSVSWGLSGNTILLKKWEDQNQPLNMQESIEGHVTDAETGEPIPGVNILVKGTSTGASTDADGNFELMVPSLNDTLIFSYIGYETQEVPVNGRSELDIQLVPQTVKGGEMVVTAFGKKTKAEDVVGSITSLDEQTLNALETAPSANLTSSLAGRVPGIIGFQRSGAPGADNAEFFVRGVTSFGYNSSPLILIDEIESSVDDLANLNPSDIADFSVLMDATATSLYGNKAANGVILVETKEGKQGKAKINLRVSTNVSEPTDVPEFADAITFMQGANQAVAYRDPSAPFPYSQRKIDETLKPNANPYLYPTTDWREELFKDYAINQKVDLSVSGGGEVARYYVSGSFNNSNGLFKVPKINSFNSNINNKNYSLRSNVDIDLTNSTQLSTKINGDFSQYTGPLQSGSDVYRLLTRANPVRFPSTYPIDSTFAYTEQPLFGGGRENFLNPYAEMVKGYKSSQAAKINAQVILEQDLSSIIYGMGFKGRFNVQRYAFNAHERSYNPFYYQAATVETGPDAYNSYRLSVLNPEEGTNYLSYNPGAETVTSNYLIEGQFDYQNDLGKKGNVNSFLVFQAKNQTYDGASDLQSSLPHRNLNLAGRLSYSYDSRYNLEFNFGYNSSERFSKNHRWGFFPSFGLSWNISNEKFWQPIVSIIDLFKIRLTHGYSGNDAVGPPDNRFLYLSTVNLDDSDYGYTTGVDGGYQLNGVGVSRYSNPKVTWERARQTNLGIELRLFKEFEFETDFYHQYRTNIYETRVDLPSSMGLMTTPGASTGEVKSYGFNSRIKYTPDLNENWFLQIRGNFTYATNEYVKYSEPNYPNAPNKSHMGQPVNQVFGLYADHLFIDEEDVENHPEQNFGPYSAGDIKYRDVNGDGIISELDEVPLGFPTVPEITYGFGFSAQFKTFDLSAFFQGLARTSFWIDAGATSPYVDNHQLLKAYADDHWSVNNRDITALFPRFSTDNVDEGYSNNTKTSSWFMRDGSFLRVKEIQVGYSLPQHIIESLSMNSVRFYLNAQNLYRFSHFKMWDPEMGGNGLAYPLQRRYNLGIAIKL